MADRFGSSEPSECSTIDLKLKIENTVIYDILASHGHAVSRWEGAVGELCATAMKHHYPGIVSIEPCLNTDVFTAFMRGQVSHSYMSCNLNLYTIEFYNEEDFLWFKLRYS